jgi:hypothetical protein
VQTKEVQGWSIVAVGGGCAERRPVGIFIGVEEDVGSVIFIVAGKGG